MDVNPNLTLKGQRDYTYVQKALKENSQEAYTYLWNQYYNAVYRHMFRITQNHDDAEDLTIEAYTKAFSKLHLYTPEFTFSTWLYRIAKNNAIDYKRRTRINTVSMDGVDSDEKTLIKTIVDNEPGPDDLLLQIEQRQLLRELIQKLKPRYRELIELRYFQMLSYEEIASRLHLPVGTVKVRLFRARDLIAQTGQFHISR